MQKQDGILFAMFGTAMTTGHFSALADSSNVITRNRFPSNTFLAFLGAVQQFHGVTNPQTISTIRHFLHRMVENKIEMFTPIQTALLDCFYIQATGFLVSKMRAVQYK